MERRKKHSREEAVHVYIEDHDHDRRSHWTAIMMMYLSLAGDCCHNRRQPPSPQLQRGRKAKKKQKRKISISIFAYYYCYYVCLLLCCCCCCNVFPSISLEAITKQSMKKKTKIWLAKKQFHNSNIPAHSSDVTPVHCLAFVHTISDALRALC